MEQKTLISKNYLEKIPMEFFTDNLPILKNTKESVALTIGKWLVDEIKVGFRKQKISSGQLLPSKAQFAYALGVSIGTIQNALKYCADLGCIDAKPCIGTVVKDTKQEPIFYKKNSSKRDKILFEVKKYIKEKKFNIGDKISYPTEISKSMNVQANSIRFALDDLCYQGILKHVLDKNVSRKGSYV